MKKNAESIIILVVFWVIVSNFFGKNYYKIGSVATNNRKNLEHASQIFEEYGDFIKKVILFRVNNEEKAQDLYQDFFLALVAKPVPANVVNIRAYLFRAITNDVFDSGRRVKKYKEILKKYYQNSDISINKSHSANALIDEEQKEKMYEFFDEHLSASSSVAIRHRYKEGKSIQEVAEVMKVKDASVCHYISKGLDKLRKIL